jgi:signal transduction histidine kinase
MAGSLAMLVLAWLLTQPIKRLDRASRAFAEGNYDKRLATRSRDEIGDLTRTYNWMADNIEDKIEALELAVRQREDFVANFAHELKTPMTSIIGYADTLYQKQLTPQQVHEAAGYIVNEGMRLEALSFKLMELITMERQNFLLEEMEMKELFQDVRETVLPLAQKRGIELSVHAAEGYARIEYDLFKTLLLNLLDNALKSGGSRVQMNGWVEGERYYIAVMDNGRGIPVDQLDRITEAFYMVDKSRSRKEHGAGLGLALCAKIAAIHGTKLDYASEEGQGTSVELALPLCPAMDEEG